MVNNKPVVNSLWHGILQKELTEKFNNASGRSAPQNDTNHQNNSGSSGSGSCNLFNNSNIRGVMRYVVDNNPFRSG